MATPDRVDVAVVGGAAGALIARRLVAAGKTVALFCRTEVQGATDTNQKWLHSGLLYPNGELAQRAWRNRRSNWDPFLSRYRVGSETGWVVARDAGTVQQRESAWADWRGRGLDIARPMRLPDSTTWPEAFGATRPAGGWETPDCALDFPAFLADTRADLGDRVVREGVRVTGITYRTARTPFAEVVYEGNGVGVRISAAQVVLAAGAWCPEFLPPAARQRLPIIRKKCVVLVYEGQLVDRVTVCLDVEKDDRSRGDVTLVPFRGTTLAAGTDFKVVYDGTPVEHLRAGDREVESLLAELHQCFPGLEGRRSTARVCVKTENFHPDHPDVEPVVYGEPEHGVPGLTVALPGKASLMFDLAELVADRLR